MKYWMLILALVCAQAQAGEWHLELGFAYELGDKTLTPATGTVRAENECAAMVNGVCRERESNGIIGVTDFGYCSDPIIKGGKLCGAYSHRSLTHNDDDANGYNEARATVRWEW